MSARFGSPVFELTHALDKSLDEIFLQRGIDDDAVTAHAYLPLEAPDDRGMYPKIHIRVIRHDTRSVTAQLQTYTLEGEAGHRQGTDMPPDTCQAGERDELWNRMQGKSVTQVNYVAHYHVEDARRETYFVVDLANNKPPLTGVSSARLTTTALPKASAGAIERLDKCIG